MAIYNLVLEEFDRYKNATKAKNNEWFFKSYEGGYAYGDKFLGLTVPIQRKIVKKFYKEITLEDIKKLLYSKYHEHRLTAVLFLVEKFSREKDEEIRKQYVDFYLANRSQVNNWDIVDSSAHKILGEYLLEKIDRSILYELAKSAKLWDQRISIIATYQFIHNDQFEDTLKISEILLDHEHDLIHKAVGWMLRELGKRDQDTEEQFLKKHYKKMPRTMLRYAIEKFDKIKRDKYLKGEI